jgi:tetratricopeptide (TPR) repeat protein
MFFGNLDIFYENVITNPDNLQLFLQKCMENAIDIQKDHHDIEPGFPVDNFPMKIYGNTIERSIITVAIPNCKKPLDCNVIAFPCKRENARYITSELSFDPITGETFKIMGEWAPDGDSTKHSNYGRVDIHKKDGFQLDVIKLVYGKEQKDKELEQYDKANILTSAGWSCFKNGSIKEALDCFNKVLEIENDNALFFHCRCEINKALGTVNAADYDLFRAKLIDMIDTANGVTLSGEAEKEFGLEQREPLVKTCENFTVFQNHKSSLLFCINPCEGDVRQPELFYSGGVNALLRRRIDQYIFLENIPEDIRKELNTLNEILITEKKPENNKDIQDEYKVPVRYIPDTGSLNSIEDIREDGYLLFVFLTSIARTQNEKPLTKTISKEEFSNLAAILAKEEDYELLDKFIAEGLPLNERLGWWFKDWQPTPLFYITANKVWSNMKEPVKMLHYLVNNGADPNIASIEGDTPLGNQCLTKGTSIQIMKALLDCGADPNAGTVSGEFIFKPLTFVLLPEEYDSDEHTFKHHSAESIEKAILLINAGADVNENNGLGLTPLGLVITFGAREQRTELIKLLLEKGADVDIVISDLENNAEQDSPEYSFALYEFYRGIPGMEKWQNQEKALKYLNQSVKSGYKPAIEALKLPSPHPCLD